MSEATLTRDAARVQTFVLVRISLDATEGPVSEHPDFTSGWETGTAAVHAEPDYAFSLYADGQRVARFGHARLSPRLSSVNLDLLVTL